MINCLSSSLSMLPLTDSGRRRVQNKSFAFTRIVQNDFIAEYYTYSTAIRTFFPFCVVHVIMVERFAYNLVKQQTTIFHRQQSVETMESNKWNTFCAPIDTRACLCLLSGNKVKLKTSIYCIRSRYYCAVDLQSQMLSHIAMVCLYCLINSCFSRCFRHHRYRRCPSTAKKHTQKLQPHSQTHTTATDKLLVSGACNYVKLMIN